MAGKRQFAAFRGRQFSLEGLALPRRKTCGQFRRCAFRVDDEQVRGRGVTDFRQGVDETRIQFSEILRLEFQAQNALQRVSFALPYLVVGVVQRQNDAEMQLFPGPAGIVRRLRPCA